MCFLDGRSVFPKQENLNLSFFNRKGLAECRSNDRLVLKNPGFLPLSAR